MKDPILHVYRSNLHYALDLVKGLPADKLCAPVHGIVNHPTWQIGHLVVGSNFAAVLMGAESVCPREWEKLFGPGSQPINDASAYPAFEELVKTFEKAHAVVEGKFKDVSDSTLSQVFPMENMRAMFPTVGVGLLYLMTTHEGQHLGQISSWRRTQGMKSMF